MTKEKIKAMLKMIRNLEEQRSKLANEVLSALPEELEDDSAVRQALIDVEEGTITADEAMKQIGSLYDCENGRKCNVPEIEVNLDTSITVKQPVNGGSLITAICSPDEDGTEQAVVMYADEDGTEYDLAMAEVKRGELAKCSGMPADNKDIDLYVWSDPSDEEYQNKYMLTHESFCQ